MGRDAELLIVKKKFNYDREYNLIPFHLDIGERLSSLRLKFSELGGLTKVEMLEYGMGLLEWYKSKYDSKDDIWEKEDLGGHQRIYQLMFTGAVSCRKGW